MENATNPNSNYEQVSGCAPVVGVAGPGVDPIYIKKNKEGNDNKKMDNLEYNLKDVKFTIAYVTLLNNIADAHHVLDDMDSRRETLSSALKAIDSHKDNIACIPILGRTLGQIAIDNVLSYQAVTAEGLFRSALDKFALSDHHDNRNRYEKANILLAYGHLLLKWEKREDMGKRLINESYEIYRSLYGNSNDNSISNSIDDVFKGITLTQAIQFQCPI